MLERINGDFLVGASGTPIDNAGMAAAIGSPDDAAWNGTNTDATMISLLKAIALNTATT